MARRTVIRKKPKVVRKTKSETYLVNQKYLGDEPSYKGELSQAQYARALTWYNYMCNVGEAREYLETYLKNQARTAEVKTLKGVPDTWINTTAAWIARMISRGLELPQSARGYLEDKLKESYTHTAVSKKSSEEKKETVSIQDRIKEKASELIGEVEYFVDERDNMKDFSLYEWLKKNEIPALYAPMIASYYAPMLQELLDALSKEDEQLTEAYSKYSKKKMEYDVKFFNSIIEEAERYASNTKKSKKPRKPRAISVEKRLKNLKYQKEDNTLKIASIDPEKILGAQELWTFNTKYKTLTVFRAMNREGLQVKGTSIINYDEQSSLTKRTGRKPEYFIDRVLNGGKIVLRKLMDEMDKETSLAYRINENTIILRAL